MTSDWRNALNELADLDPSVAGPKTEDAFFWVRRISRQLLKGESVFLRSLGPKLVATARSILGTIEKLQNPGDEQELRTADATLIREIGNLEAYAQHMVLPELISVLEHFGPNLANLGSRLAQLEERAAKPDAAVERAAKAADEAERIAARAKETSEHANEVLQQALLESGVGQNERYFVELEKRFALEAADWLSRAGWALSVTIFLGFTYLVLALADVLKFNSIPAGGALLLFFSALASLTVFCARSYRSSHQRAAVNGHRAVALRTFMTFRESATDENTKNAILTMIAQLCFTGEDTGLGTKVDIITPAQGARTAVTD